MSSDYDNFIKLAIENLPERADGFLAMKKNVAKKTGLPLPTNADMREVYERMVAKKEIGRSEKLEKLLFSKKVRTASGVAVVAVLTKPHPCPGKCLYCPTEKNMPKSYLSNEPAVMRAISAKFNPYLQVQRRLRALELNGHKTDKIEIIVMGGTFSYFSKNYQKKFITECFRACNDYPHKLPLLTKERAGVRLAREQKRNETTKHRIIGLTLETRPDYIDTKEIINFRNLGCTRVELGVQNIFNDVLKINRRGHNVKETIHATKLLKSAGFKINYHIMPGLLGSTPKRDYLMFQKLFANPDFQPDMLKIYPTVVLKDSALYNFWKKKKYIPLTDKNFEKLIVKIKNETIPPYVRIARLVRDVPESSIIAGPKISNLRQLVAKKTHCKCIRCREVRGNYLQNEKIILDQINYNASDGKEIFLQYVSQDKRKLFALLRLRINNPANVETQSFASLQGAAIIRELHTYGKMTEINKSDAYSPQHIGLGKKLVLEAESIARKEFDCKKIAIISGVGVREYYRKIGYRLKDSYMVKSL